MFVDSHAHLDKDISSTNINNIVKNSNKNNVSSILSINTKISEFDQLYKLIKNYNSIWCSVGEHPCNIRKDFIPSKDLILSKINKKVIGIGETGIDLYYSKNNIDFQIESLKNHIDASIESDLPIIIHMRDSENELMEILCKENHKNKLKLVMHCFLGSKELLNKCLDQDFYISISGIVTFKKSFDLQNLIKDIPLNRLLIETDSPFLSPVPYRGKQNEPSYIIHTADYISSILDIDISIIANTTSDNFYNLFSKAKKYEKIHYES